MSEHLKDVRQVPYSCICHVVVIVVVVAVAVAVVVVVALIVESLLLDLFVCLSVGLLVY